MPKLAPTDASHESFFGQAVGPDIFHHAPIHGQIDSNEDGRSEKSAAWPDTKLDDRRGAVRHAGRPAVY
jgi:hypothetical protein